MSSAEFNLSIQSTSYSTLHSPIEASSTYHFPLPAQVKLGEPQKPELSINQHSTHPTSVLGKISKFFEENPKVVTGLKVLGVALVVAGLIAASVFSFGAAVPLIAAIGAGSSIASVTGAFALLGTGIGLALSSVWTVVAAKITDMHKATSSNLSDFAVFLALSLGGSALITGLFAASGAGLGLKGAIAAKAGLSTFGTAAVFGIGAAGVRALMNR